MCFLVQQVKLVLLFGYSLPFFERYDTHDEGQKFEDTHFVGLGRCAIDNEPQFLHR